MREGCLFRKKAPCPQAHLLFVTQWAGMCSCACVSGVFPLGFYYLLSSWVWREKELQTANLFENVTIQALPKLSLRDMGPYGWACEGKPVCRGEQSERILRDRGLNRVSYSYSVMCFSWLLLTLVMAEVNLLLLFLSLRCGFFFSVNILWTMVIHCSVTFMVYIHFH